MSDIRHKIQQKLSNYKRSILLTIILLSGLYACSNDMDVNQDKTYSEQQIINYSAALLTHELGHLLLHLGHPFGDKHCIMSPTVMLNYRQWYDNLDAGQCAIGSSAAMTPGAAKIIYNRRW